MSSIVISESNFNKDNLLYIQQTLAELIAKADAKVMCEANEKRAVLSIECPDYYTDIISAEVSDKIAEIIAVKYKYDFFKKTIKLNGLNNNEYEILIASLISADLDDDKRYSFDRVKSITEVAIDGVFNFRLQPLKKKWKEVANYIPESFINTQLKDFIVYLLENKKRRCYVDSGRVYDWHYRRLKRTTLLDGEEVRIIREVLLSNCGEIEINGNVPKLDEFYMKEYFKDKIYFS